MLTVCSRRRAQRASGSGSIHSGEIENVAIGFLIGAEVTAIGSALESDDAVREAACAYRPSA